MTEGLKAGWRRVRFGDVVKLNLETSKDPAADGLDRYVGLEHLEPGDLRIRSWGEIADGTTFTNRFRPGQVLFGKRRAYQRKVALADFDGICSGDIYVLESRDPNLLLPELLPFICQTDGFFEHAVATSAGSLSPRTNWTSLAEYKLRLPPLDEQARIIRPLRATDTTVSALRDTIDTLDRTETASLIELMSVNALAGRAPSLENSTSSIRTTPLMPMRNVSDCIVPGRKKPRFASKPHTSDVLPWVTIPDISGTVIGNDTPAARIAIKELASCGARIVPPGTVLIACIRAIGLVAITQVAVSFNQQLHAFQADRRYLRPDYLVYALRAQKRQMLSRAAETLVPYLNKENCESIIIPVPKLHVQDEIANFYDQFEQCRGDLTRRLANTLLVRSILIDDTIAPEVDSG